ncbi:GIY-YIG nuclease family protein [Patescibacteria group bacterium]|nr:GIY-YIG nuclease family protein [Patescibacteria group bacterium]
MPHCAYLARCNDNSLYAGYTTDLQAREAAHNQGKGARYTRARRPVKIVYFETFPSKQEAMRREYQFKQLSKKEREELVAKATPVHKP